MAVALRPRKAGLVNKRNVCDLEERIFPLDRKKLDRKVAGAADRDNWVCFGMTDIRSSSLMVDTPRIRSVHEQLHTQSSDPGGMDRNIYNVNHFSHRLAAPFL